MPDAELFSQAAWTATVDLRTAIDEHPFLLALQDGSLPVTAFGRYLAQDAHYLVGYARALSLCAAQATDTAALSFWAGSARDAIVVERTLHESRLADLAAVTPSPTCTGYVSFLLGTAGLGCYPVLAAALLPCFWIYADVARRLAQTVIDADHPYADWIATYDDPAFAASARQARDIVDALAESSSASVRARMHDAFVAAARYEWLFFDAAWRGEAWPDFSAANGRATSTATTNEATEADSHG